MPRIIATLQKLDNWYWIRMIQIRTGSKVQQRTPSILITYSSSGGKKKNRQKRTAEKTGKKKYRQNGH